MLITPGTTHITVTCWSCRHTVDLRPDQVPAGITQHEFEKRARCAKCGTGWPQVVRHPRAKTVWDRKA